MRRFFFLLLAASNTNLLFASDNFPLGARSSGMGNASVSLNDVWAVQNNQAALGLIKTVAFGVSYLNPFMIQELGTKAFGAALPVKDGTFGLMVSDYGYHSFHRNKIGLGFGKCFDKKFSAGISLDYLSTVLGDEFYGNKHSFIAEIGILALPLKNLVVGAHVYNPTRVKLGTYNDERIPTVMRIGVNYTFSEKVLITMETEKDIETKGMLKAGLEYTPMKEFYIRTGISTNPSLSCFGLGLAWKHFKLDISSTYHSTLGISPQIGLIYEFRKNSQADGQHTNKDNE